MRGPGCLRVGIGVEIGDCVCCGELLSQPLVCRDEVCCDTVAGGSKKVFICGETGVVGRAWAQPAWMAMWILGTGGEVDEG